MVRRYLHPLPPFVLQWHNLFTDFFQKVSMNDIRGVLFDADGTLIDTYDIILASMLCRERRAWLLA